MLNSQVNSTDIRLLLSEVIWLELEDFDHAIDNSKLVNSEAQQWQTYLNTLAMIGCEKWLSTRIPPQKVVTQEMNVLEEIYNLEVGEFKICPIAIEHVLDEVINIPRTVIEKSELAVHFYVVVEVLEEEEQVIIRGFLRYDELMNYCSQLNLELRDGFYQVPLSLFDDELNHLLFYYYFSEPLAIPLPVVSDQSSGLSLQRSLDNTRTKLSQWLEGVFEQGWQTIDTLINPEANLALSTRITHRGAKKAKLIDLGVQLGYQTVALLVNITEESDEKFGVLIQVHPTGGERYLPPSLKLTLLSKAGKTLQEVTSRSQDNYIQLKFFKGESGKRFSVELSLGENIKVKEDFEL